MSWMVIPSFVMLVSLLAPLTVVVVWKRTRASQRRSPLTTELLRGPGESLRGQIDDVSIELVGHLGLSVLPLVWAYMWYVSWLAFSGRGVPDWVTWTLLLGGVGGQIYYAVGMWRLFKRRRDLTLGYEAEVAVGQELNGLLRQGYHVFHDVPLGKSNVDHIVVGKNGIFAIETKGRAKPRAKGSEPSHQVIYDGQFLQFPGWPETEPLKQAARQAKWVGEWLSKSVGEKLTAEPLLVLPGWMIKRTAPSGIPVLAAPNVAKYLPKMGSRQGLEDSLIQRIVYQLDQRCRTVAPRAYQDESAHTEQR